MSAMFRMRLKTFPALKEIFRRVNPYRMFPIDHRFRKSKEGRNALILSREDRKWCGKYVYVSGPSLELGGWPKLFVEGMYTFYDIETKTYITDLPKSCFDNGLENKLDLLLEE
jgi:hypothetical protein